ncbi:MAG: hypothetical protein IT320_24075 [Anaerolineae bacterium]|nr:hypothetical protein [Anaerolineae bacterium]
MGIVDEFQTAMQPAWIKTEVGTGRVQTGDDGLQLTVTPSSGHTYSNAQISDYNYQSFQFLWRPPVRLTVTAHASLPGDQLRGTAGFGFWNHPFSPDVSAHRLPRLPQAIWFFFGSPPNDMRLAHGVPGYGWKAAQIDAGRRSALALIPLALPALLLLRSPAIYDRVYPGIQRALAIGEYRLDDALLAHSHTYTIDWRQDGATFAIDEQTVLETTATPRGPCGFIAWVDNQYAVVTPQGRFGSGIIPLENEQTLWLRHIAVEPRR